MLRVLLPAALLFATAPTLARPSPDGQSAREQFLKAKKAYELGHFEDALQGYSEAYRIDARPETLFNIAQCLRLLGQYQRAGFYYRQFLDLGKPGDKTRKLVEDLLAEVDAKKAEAERAAQSQEELLRQNELDAARAAGSLSAADPRPNAPVEATVVHDDKPLADPKVHALTAVPADAKPTIMTVTPPTRVTAKEPMVLTRQWWFWAGLGAVAVGAGAGVYVATSPQPLATTLGTRDLR